jgi:two-component system, NarL family, nitrate/nitrite response regulator NarL
MQGKIRIAVVDEQPLYRDGVISALDAEPDMEVVGQGETATDAIQIAHASAPDVLLMDMNIPGGGLNTLCKIALRYPSAKILVLTASDDENEVRTALRKGARGYLLKETHRTELVNAVRMVSKGQSYVSPGFAAQLIMLRGVKDKDKSETVNQFPELSDRERQILMLILQGRSNRTIGDELGLTEKTIKGYLTAIMEKLQVRNRLEAAILAAERMSEKQTFQN